MSNRLDSCTSRVRSPTHSRGTMQRNPCCEARGHAPGAAVSGRARREQRRPGYCAAGAQRAVCAAAGQCAGREEVAGVHRAVVRRSRLARVDRSRADAAGGRAAEQDDRIDAARREH
eukprot:5670858-Prymnesium_polylepis.1